MANDPHQMLLLDGSIEPDMMSEQVGGGEMVAYTARAPDKDTDNQDAVAIIPYGPDACVLVVADGAGELIQMVGIAVKAGLTKEDFDRTCAVHPTMSEELVTMATPVRSA